MSRTFSTTSLTHDSTASTPQPPTPINSTSSMQFRQTALALLHKIQHGLSSPRIELVYATHAGWPLPATSSSVSGSRERLRISVLDSSFNPPTRAHLALANAPYPSLSPPAQDAVRPQYDATLLLLSVRNADKSLSPGDATYLQRLEMMRLLSGDITQGGENGAIAIIDEPTFVGKERVLKGFLESRLAGGGCSADVSLTFLLGMDTLERLFAPRYYGSYESMMTSLGKFFDEAKVVCARRRMGLPSSSMSPNSTAVPPREAARTPPAEGLPTEISPGEESEALRLARPFLSSGRIKLIDIGEREAGFSSSAVRADVRQQGYGVEGELRAKEGWRDWVTKDVADYIVQEGLFLPKESESVQS